MTDTNIVYFCYLALGSFISTYLYTSIYVSTSFQGTLMLIAGLDRRNDHKSHPPKGDQVPPLTGNRLLPGRKRSHPHN